MQEEDNLLTFPHFRPCGVLPEVFDDPLADLLTEFEEMEQERSPALETLPLDLEEPASSRPSSPMEHLSLALAQLNRQLQELGLAQQRIHFYLDEIESNLPED